MTRTLHWMLAVTVLAAAITGFLFYYRGMLDITSREAKYTLIAFHALIGYGVTIIVVIRMIWAFTGPANARWSRLLPGATHFMRFLRDLGAVVSFKKGASLGPVLLNRVMIFVTILMMILMSVTGVFQAAMNFYDWPFGGMVRNYVAAEGVDPKTIKSRDMTGIDRSKLQRIGTVKKYSSRTHYYSAFFVLFLSVGHIVGVVLMDGKRRGGVVSPMIIGKRYGPSAGDPSAGRDHASSRPETAK